MVAGRPGHDIEAEAEELRKWADTDDALILRYFAPMRGYSTGTMYRWVSENDKFRDAFEYARDMIGCRREMIYLTAKSEAPFKRYAPMYDTKLHEFERGEKVFDAQLDQDTEKASTEEIKQKLDDTLDALRDLRKPAKQD
jgi:hypothetical protein